MEEILKMLEETEIELDKLNNGLKKMRECLRYAVLGDAEIKVFGKNFNALNAELSDAAFEADELIKPAETIYNNLPKLRDAIDNLIGEQK